MESSENSSSITPHDGGKLAVEGQSTARCAWVAGLCLRSQPLLHAPDVLRVAIVPLPVPCDGVRFRAPLRAALRLLVGISGGTDTPLLSPGIGIDGYGCILACRGGCDQEGIMVQRASAAGTPGLQILRTRTGPADRRRRALSHNLMQWSPRGAFAGLPVAGRVSGLRGARFQSIGLFWGPLS